MSIGAALATVLVAVGSGPGDQTLSASRVTVAVQEALHARLPAGARVTVGTAIRDQALPPGKVSIAVGAVAGRWPRAHVIVPVRLEVDGRLVRTLSVAAAVSAPTRVLTYDATYATHAGDDVRVSPAVVDMTCCAGSPIIDLEAIAGMRLRRAVQAGEPAMREDFELTPDIGARDNIRVVVVEGAVRITAHGTALSDGRVGDRIPVRTAYSNAPLQARVVGPQEVLVDD